MQSYNAVTVKLLHDFNFILDVLKSIFLFHSSRDIISDKIFDSSQHVFVENFKCVVVVGLIYMRKENCSISTFAQFFANAILVDGPLPEVISSFQKIMAQFYNVTFAHLVLNFLDCFLAS